MTAKMVLFKVSLSVIVLIGLSVFMLASCTSKKVEQADPYKGFRMGVQSYSLRAFSVQEAIRDVKELGLHFIEIYPGHFPVTSTAEEKEALKKLLAETNVQFVAYGVCDFNGSEEEARKYFEFAKEMGIEVLSVNPTSEELDFLDKLVKEFDIKVAIHNHGPGARYDKLQDVLSAIEGRDARIGACIDTGHFMRSDEDPVNCAKKLGARVHLIHLKDLKVMPDGKKVFTIQGEGDLDMPAFFAALKEINFTGPLSLEYEEDKDNPMPGMKTSLENIQKALAKL